jgi:predicted permease
VLILGLTLKLVLWPLCALGFLKLLSLPPLVLQVAVLETAMPSMITAGAVLMAAGLAVELVAALVGWGLIFSLITVPAWAFILGGL